MLRKKKGDLEWLEFELLADDPRIVHGVFLRKGGVSNVSFGSLNVLRGCGDEPENVKENRRRISHALQLPGIISTWQVHGSDIFHVKDINASPYPLRYDGMMTNRKNLGLMTMHADCQAAIFYDPIHQAIATVHAGWRGQVKNIYREIIQKMKYTFQSHPSDLLVCISPSLGPENSEFKHYLDEFPEEFWLFQVKPAYFDLWAIAQHQLARCGILPHHIEIARIDTYTTPQDYFSYRREKAKGILENITGGHGTVAAIL